MKLVNIRSFVRGGYRTETEPVQVLRGSVVIGTWVPAGQENRQVNACRPDRRMDDKPALVVVPPKREPRWWWLRRILFGA